MNPLFTSFFVVWRETFEAFLILFLIWTALSKQGYWSQARTYVVSGVALGIALSGFFAWGVLEFSDAAESETALLLQAIFPLLAAGLMFHMVHWMAGHAKQISGEIKAKIGSGSSMSLTWGIFGIVAYALSREGFETVVYLYGMSMNPLNAHFTWAHYVGVLFAGVAASCGTLWILQRGLAFFKLKTFFFITNIFLLGTASSLLAVGINKLIEQEYLPPLVDPIWNSSDLISGESFAGQALNLLFGYTPQPSLTLALAIFLYWLAAGAFQLAPVWIAKSAR